MQSKQELHVQSTQNDCTSILKNSFLFLFVDIERTDTVWYRALTGHLTSEQQKTLQDIIFLGDQLQAALESKRIEQSGGK